MSQRDEISPRDIFDLYKLYREFKFYYEFYWAHQETNNITKDDIDKKIQNIIKQHSTLKSPIEALCFYANIPVSELFNKDKTPKNISELETLKMIREANYGKIDY